MKGFIELIDFDGRKGVIRATAVVAVATSVDALVPGAPLYRTMIELEGRGSYYYTPESSDTVVTKLEEALNDERHPSL